MKSLASVSINYLNYRIIMPDYPGRFFLMARYSMRMSDGPTSGDTPTKSSAIHPMPPTLSLKRSCNHAGTPGVMNSPFSGL